MLTLPLPLGGTKVSPSPPRFIVALLIAWTLALPARFTAQVAMPPTNPAEQPGDTLNLSDEVVHDVLSPFQQAIETRNYRLLLSTFDAAATPEFLQLREQFEAFFRLHDNIRFRYQLLQVSADKDVSFAVADVDMDAQPADTLPTEQRRSTQMRFQMTRTPKGWRLTGLKPMSFFTQ